MRNSLRKINIAISVLLILILCGILSYNVFFEPEDNNINHKWFLISPKLEARFEDTVDFSYAMMENADVSTRVCNEKVAEKLELRNLGNEKIIIENEDIIIEFSGERVETVNEIVNNQDDTISVVQEYPIVIKPGETITSYLMYDVILPNKHVTNAIEKSEAEINVKYYIRISGEKHLLEKEKQNIISCSTSPK